jgi:sugar fermentation stimulation protein A
MIFDPPLQQGVLLRRYKRFLADIEDAQGRALTIHCPNTGSMQGCVREGAPIWYSRANNPKRKYAHTWEIIEIEPEINIGINTQLANTLVKGAWENAVVPELTPFKQLKGEQKFGQERSRVDWLFTDEVGTECYVEVKNVTLVQAQQALFPDAVTARGQKHLRELTSLVREGTRAMLFFCVQHTAAKAVGPADHIDPEYGRLLREAMAAGVQIVAYRADISPLGIELKHRLPVILDTCARAGIDRK